MRLTRSVVTYMDFEIVRNLYMELLKMRILQGFVWTFYLSHRCFLFLLEFSDNFFELRSSIIFFLFQN